MRIVAHGRLVDDRPADRRCAPDAPVLDIVTEVDWHERQKLLKLAFPLDVHADRASLGDPVRAPVPADPHQHLLGRGPLRDLRAPLGARRRARLRRRGGQRRDLRPRHHAAATRPGGGTTTTVRLSLLRAPLFPDPQADQGRHRFAVALRSAPTHRRRGGRGLPAQPAAAPGPGRAPGRAAADRGPPGGRGRGGEAGRGRQRRRDGPALRGARRRGRRRGSRPGFAYTSVVETDLLERPLPEPSPRPAPASCCARSRSLRCASDVDAQPAESSSVHVAGLARGGRNQPARGHHRIRPR